MAFETVTGYCWPQSVDGRASTVGAAPVVGRRAAGRGRGGPGRRRARRSCSATTPSPPTTTPRRPTRRPDGCGWPAALALDVDPAWRSGYYEVVLEIDVDGKRRRSHAFFVVRPPSARRRRRSCWRWPPTPGTPTTTSAAATSTPAAPTSRCSGRWRRATCTSRRAPGRRVTVVDAARPADGRPRRLPAAQPPVALGRLGGLARLGAAVPRSGPSARATPSTSSPTPTSRTTPSCSPSGGGYRLFLSVGHDEYWSGPMRDTVEGFIGRRRQRRLPLRQHLVLAGAPRGPDARGPGGDDGRLQGPLQAATRCSAPTASASSPASGPTTSSAGPRTT